MRYDDQTDCRALTPEAGPQPMPNRWIRFDGTFSLGNILIVLGLLGTSYAGYIRNSERMELALRDIAGLQQSVARTAERAVTTQSEQARVNREQLQASAAQFQSIILGLQNNMADSIRRVEERMGKFEGALEGRRDFLDQRLESLNTISAQNRADLAVLLRSSGLPRAGDPGTRR